MRRKKWTVGLVALASSFWLSAPAEAQVNPSGWIQTAGWNMLFPLGTSFPDGANPGVAAMKLEWIAPSSVRDVTFNPRFGSEHDGADLPQIAFNGASPAIGYFGGNLATSPTWVTEAFLEAPGVFGSIPGFNLPGGVNLVDYQAMAVHISTVVVPLVPGAVALRNDQCMGVATTYVRNDTGANLAVDVCTKSDDSIQVWVNNRCITNVSIPRGSGGAGGDCQERNPAVLPPGVSKITSLVWEGGGGWDFGVALEVAGVKLADGNSMVTFLGSGVPGDGLTGQLQLEVTRSTPLEKSCPADPARPLKVTITGNAAGDPDEMVTVCETVSASNNAAITITDISNGGTVEQLGFTNVHVSRSTTGGDIWDGCDSFLYDYDVITGDFDVSIKFLSRQHATGLGRWGKFGIMARTGLGTDAQYSHAQDHLPDLQDATRHAGRRGPGDNGCGVNAMFELGGGLAGHPTYQRLKRTGQVIQMWTSNNPAVETSPTNDALWTAGHAENWMVSHTAPAPEDLFVGFANSEHNSDGAPAQTIAYQILSGGPFATTALVGSDAGGQSASSVGDIVTGWKIAWTVSRAKLADGLCYNVRYAEPGQTSHSGQVVGEVAVGGPSSITWRGGQSGPLGGGTFDNSHDIGSVAFQGSTTYDGSSTYTSKGSGADIWGSNDRFHYTYKCVSGDFDVRCRVTDRRHPNVGRWGRHGLMARYTCDLNSKYSAIFTLAGEGGGSDGVDIPRHQFEQTHPAAGDPDDSQQVGDFVLLGYPNTGDRRVDRRPEWFRLVRRGSRFVSYLSFAGPDGEPLKWSFVGEDDHGAGAPAEILVGFANGSHGTINGEALVEVDFDRFSCEAITGSAQVCESLGALNTLTYGSPSDMGIVVVRSGAYTPEVIGGRLRLTRQDTGSSATHVWYGVPADPLGGGVPLLEEGFTAEFDAFMTRDGLLDPADGMTFAVVATGTSDILASAVAPFPPSLDVATLGGDGGGAIGYAGGTLAQRHGHPSFSVEMDNWEGGGNNEPVGAGAPNNDGAYHFGLNYNANVNSLQTNVQLGVATNALPNIFDPDGIHVEVRYTPDGRVQVWAASIDGTVGRTKVLDRAIPPLPVGDVVVGFTAGTGGALCTQEVDNFSLSTQCCEFEAETVDLAGGENVLVGGAPVVVTASVDGVEDGASAECSFSIASGPGTLVDNGDCTASVTGTGAGNVVVSVLAGDGVCTNSATASHTICSENADSVSLTSDVTETRDTALLTATLSGNDGTASCTFAIVSGDELADITDNGNCTATLTCDPARGGDTGDIVVRVTTGDGVCVDGATDEVTVTCLPRGQARVIGDSNRDGRLDLSDGIHMANLLFNNQFGNVAPCGGSPQSPANLEVIDLNDDNQVDVSDVIVYFQDRFLGVAAALSIGACISDPPIENCMPEVDDCP